MRQRTQLTDEERAARHAAQQQLVKQSVEQLRSQAGWQQWLKTRKAFHRYSFGNALLIGLQHPTATRVAGFSAWLKLGYSVRKGETAIRIWAPCPPTRKQLDAWRKAGGDPDARPRTFWKLAAVFAQDQVQPLPPPADPVDLNPPAIVIAEIDGDSHAALLDRLVGFAGTIGYTVSIQPSMQADGTCSFSGRRITLAERLTPNGRLATLIHELGHALLHEEATPALNYAQEELVVESIAFCVCQTVGLDTTGNSIPYIASWSAAASIEILEQAAKLTDRLARRIEDHLLADGDPEPDGEPAAAAGEPGDGHDRFLAIAA